MNMNIPVAQAPDGTLFPCVDGNGTATVMYSQDETGARIAIISFMGVNQALVTFDESNNQAISYMLYNPAPDLATAKSVENIIRAITQLH